MGTRKTREEMDLQMQAEPAVASEESIENAREDLEVEATQEEGQGETTGEELEPEEIVSPAEAEESRAVATTPEPVRAPAQLAAIIESLLFAAGEPIGLQDLLRSVRDLQPEFTSRELKKVIEQLRVELREQGRGIRIAEVAGGYQLRTPSEAAPYIKKLVARRPPRLTRATLETLAIVAYRQPVTRGDVEEIRGVDSGAVLKHLLDKKLVKILGRKDEPGRPLVYGTTSEFLSFFSLKDLGSLPTLRDFAELSEEHRASLGLEPAQPGEQETDREQIEETLKAEFTDAYAPVGEDEVVQELADAISELRQRDRALRQVLPQKPKPAPEEGQDPGQKPLQEPVPEQESAAPAAGQTVDPAAEPGERQPASPQPEPEPEENQEPESGSGPGPGPETASGA